MITFVSDDIFQSKASVWVNPVNCVGVEGAGLAKKFKKRFPDENAQYVEACRSGIVRLGTVSWVLRDVGNRHEPPRVVVYFPTKLHWLDNSRLEDIAKGLESLKEAAREFNFPSLAVPALGCGLGGLLWSDVKPLMTQYLQDLPSVTVYKPQFPRLADLWDY